MEYVIKMEINLPRDLVSQLYVDHPAMLEWEKGLVEIESTHGILFQTGSQGLLWFQLPDSKMKMHVMVESSDLPEMIVLIYQVPGAYNRCVNRFESKQDKTLWTMDVEFRFEAEMNLPKERFIEKTTQGMQLFKDYCEKRISA